MPFGQAPARDWGIEPVSDDDRVLSVQDYTALWAFFLIGLPVLLAGVRLTAAPGAGGLGFSAGQLVLAILLGALGGSFLMALVAWAGAFNGVPTGVMLRPSLGLAGGRVLALLNLVFLLGWAALELRIAARGLDQAVVHLGGRAMGVGAVAAVAATAGVLVWMGPRVVAVWWVRRFAVWPALGLFLYLLWRLLQELDLQVVLAQPRAPGFWAGVDLVVALSIIWLPLLADTARLVSDESSAASGAGVGFGVSVILVVLVGALLGLTGWAADPDPQTVVGALIGQAGAAAGLILLAWVVLGEIDQPFAFLHSAGVTAQTLIERPAAILYSLVFLVLAAVGGATLDPRVMLQLLELLLSLYVPILGVFLADFYVVRRRRYDLDALYRADGPYRGVNLMALLPLLVGFIAFQWIDPTGPEAWVSLVRSTIPGGVPLGQLLVGLPPAMLALVISFSSYGVIGRWRVEEEVHVWPIKGRL